MKSFEESMPRLVAEPVPVRKDLAPCEVRSASVEVKTPRPLVIRNSAFGIRSVRRALIKADREMPSDELRTTNRVAPTSTFEIHPSNFAAHPGQLFYSTPLGKN